MAELAWDALLHPSEDEGEPDSPAREETKPHRGGRTYGSEAQQRRRQSDGGARFVQAIKALARHHGHLSEDDLNEKALKLLVKYLVLYPVQTVREILDEDAEKPFRVDDLIGLMIIRVHLEVMRLEGKIMELPDGTWQLTGLVGHPAVVSEPHRPLL